MIRRAETLVDGLRPAQDLAPNRREPERPARSPVRLFSGAGPAEWVDRLGDTSYPRGPENEAQLREELAPAVVPPAKDAA